MIARLILLALLGVAVAGCEPPPPTVPPFEGRTIRDRESFKPGASPYEAGELILAERTSIPIAFERTEDAERELVTFECVAHGEVVDQEVYQDRDESFSLVSKTGESFDPPLPLIVYPVRVGETKPFEWKGKVLEGEVPSNAHAMVTVSDESSNLPAPFSETIRVNVVLSLHGAGDPTKRELAFWFVEGRGLVKRSFGALDTRQPAQP